MTVIQSMSSMLRNRDGGVAIITGVVLSIAAVTVGSAVDLSNATKQRATFQNVADAAALAAARAGDNLTQSEYQKIVEDFFASSEECIQFGCETPEASINADGSISVDAMIGVDTYILKMFGMETIPVSVSSTAMPPTLFGVDVMMVLDYSGSMGRDDRYIDMANAATDFLDRAAAREGESMRVGIVPFSEYVLTPLPGRFAYSLTDGNTLDSFDIVGCTLNREYPFSVSADTPDISTIGALWPVTSYAVGSAPGNAEYNEPAGTGTIKTEDFFAQDGTTYTIEYIDLDPSIPGTDPIITEPPDGTITVDALGKFGIRFAGAQPDSSLFVNAILWDDSAQSFYNGYGSSDSYQQIADSSLPSDFAAHQLAEQLDPKCGAYADRRLWARPLSNDFEGMKEAIDQMQPYGLTNIALGLDLAWHYLTGNEPFVEAQNVAASGNRQSMILLSDGTQTVNAHGAMDAFNIDAANANITELCEAAKEDGIEIYTIAFALRDEDTRARLEECSSGNGFFHEPDSGAQLESVFDSIFESISPGKVRITG